MTFKQLQKKLEHYEAGDYQDLLQEIIDKHPEVKAFLEVKFDFLDENKVMSQYEAKIKRELAKKWVDSHGWDGDERWALHQVEGLAVQCELWSGCR